MKLRPNGLARAAVRSRPSAFAGAFVALFFGAATVSASALLVQSGVTAAADPARFADTPVVVATSDQVGTPDSEGNTVSVDLPERPLMDASVAERLAALPEVLDAVPDLTFPATPTDATTLRATAPTWSAHPWSSRQLTETEVATVGSPPQPGQVVVEAATASAAELRTGDALSLTTATGTHRFTVSSIVDERAAGDPATGPTVWFADDEASELAGHPGQVDAIAVRPAPGTSDADLAAAVRQEAGTIDARLAVFTGADRTLVEDADFAASVTTLGALGGSLGGSLLLVAIFVVMAATALSVNERSRELALLRAVGATPRQLRRMVAAEASLVALVAAPSGLVPGYFLARWLFDSLQDRGLLAEQMQLSTGPLALVGSVVVVAAAAMVAGLLAARRPARIRPAEALSAARLSTARLGPVRLLFGLAALGGSVPLIIASASPGADGAGLAPLVVLDLLLAVALLGPLVAAVIAAVAAPLLRRLGAAGHIAAANTRTNARRLAAAITPLVLALSFACTLLFLQGSLDRAAVEQNRAANSADAVVTSTGPGLPLTATPALAAADGVQTAVGVLPTTVLLDVSDILSSYSAVGLSGSLSDVSSVLDLDVESGDLAALSAGTQTGDDGTIALDSLLAGAVDARVGDRVTAYLADGTRIRPEVVAVYRRGLGIAQAVLPASTAAAHERQPLQQQVLLDWQAGAGSDARTAVQDLIGPGASIQTPDAIADAQQASGATNTWVNNVFAALLAGFAAIAAANTLVMITVSRRRDIALLGMIGATPPQVARVARAEALVVAVSATALGTGIAWAALRPAVEGATGAPPYIPIGTYLAMVAAVFLITVVGTGLPTRTLLRGSRYEAHGVRE